MMREYTYYISDHSFDHAIDLISIKQVQFDLGIVTVAFLKDMDTKLVIHRHNVCVRFFFCNLVFLVILENMLIVHT